MATVMTMVTCEDGYHVGRRGRMTGFGIRRILRIIILAFS